MGITCKYCNISTITFWPFWNGIKGGGKSLVFMHHYVASCLFLTLSEDMARLALNHPIIISNNTVMLNCAGDVAR